MKGKAKIKVTSLKKLKPLKKVEVVSPSKAKALKIVEYVLNKQGIRPVILEVAGLTTFCEYFVVCSAESPAQVHAIYDEVNNQGPKEGIKVHRWSKDEGGTWMLVDLFDVVLHIFTEETREFYNLEYLWRDAPQIVPKKKS